MTALRVGLCLLIAFSVLALGTVEVWSVSVMEMGAALLLVWWALVAFQESTAKIYWNYLHLSLLGLLVIGSLQLAFHASAYAYLTRTMVLKLGHILWCCFWRLRHFGAAKI
jgi:hypothetical protein